MVSDSRSTPAGPLAGIRVVDFSRILAGPYATMLLAELGADVIKVERPGSGDDTRTWGPPFVGDDAAYYLSVNRDKRSIELDLRDAADREVALALVDGADVVVENFRQGVMGRLGLDYETIRARNPAIVYCSIPAYSRSLGDDRPGYDLLMQAATGLMSLTGDPDGEPSKVGVAILDVVAGLFASNGVLAALRARDRDGAGQHVVVGLFEASVAALVNQAANYLLGGKVPARTGNAHPNIVPYQLFHAADEDFVLAAGNDKLFRLTCEVVGMPELGLDARFRSNPDRVARRDELVSILAGRFAEAGASDWVDQLTAAGVPASVVRTMDAVFASEEGRATVEEIADPERGPLRLVRSPLELSRTPLRQEHQPPPRLGEHNDEVRAEVRASADGRAGTRLGDD